MCLDGKYIIERELGRGGFGIVLLAREVSLDNRRVALKLPRPDIAWSKAQIARFREEASKVARLDERGIPTIYQIFDLIVHEQPTVCVVQQYIAGSCLSRWWKRQQETPDAYDRLATMVADIAAVLAVPHAKSLFHRDLKPDNILVDDRGRPSVLDFGLALHVNERTREEGLLAGTIPYMAPEQVRGEMRKIDARTDIWALGVSLYQLLTGKLPFDGALQHEIFAAIKEADPQPPRQIRPEIPVELERITLRCLEKLKADRYGTAGDLERDLRTWRDAPAQQPARVPKGSNATGTGGPGSSDPAIPGEPSPSDGGRRTDPIANAETSPGRQPFKRSAGPERQVESPVGNGSATAVRATAPTDASSDSSAAPSSGPPPSHGSTAAIPDRPRIVPKGLDSFGSRDADFFLELLPGIPERNLLPPSINFWRERIESDELAQQMPVGLLSGPSGCGKSSLMKAGILPRLRTSVIAVYLEATQEDTESRLLSALRSALRKSGRTIPESLSLVEVMERLASQPMGAGSPSSESQLGETKVLIVLDHFEQWLYAHRADSATVLRDALGQCDGVRLQAILMVRDDYWTPIRDFLKTLDVDLHEGENWQHVPLFDLSHARKVLTIFGQAYAKLPASPAPLSGQQAAFMNAAVASLAEKDKVVSVRLSVFAELMRSRDWTLETLAKVGGADGVGVAFLEESFAARDASPVHKRHAEAAQSVLKSLLPPLGAEIKGHNRTDEELMAAADYTRRPQDFDELIKILNGKLRLVALVFDDANRKVGYQLTHDYLVPSLRTWLSRKQTETRHGRALLRLEERAATWTAKEENRHLPSLGEYLRIATLTKRRDWTEPQQRMMRRARFIHVLRTTLATLLVAVLGTAAFTARESQRIGGLATTLVTASPEQILDIATQLDRSPMFADAHLNAFFPPADATNQSPSDASSTDPQRLLHARFASVARDPAHAAELLEVLLTGKYTYAIPIRERLRLLPAARFSAVQNELKTLLRDERATARRRFGAALALSAYVPASDPSFWEASDLAFITRELVAANPDYQPELRRALRPLEGRLRTDLERLFRDAQSTPAQRLAAANAFADYAPNETAKLADLLTVATPEQYAVLFPLVEAGRTDDIRKQLAAIASRLPPDDLGSVERVSFGQRRANAAATLLCLGEREAALPVFLMKDDPESLTQFIFRCRPRGVGVEALLDCLEIVSSAPPGRYAKEARYALLLSLAEFPLAEVPEGRQSAVLKQVRDWYATDPSSGVHGAANWLLRHWGEHAFVRQIDETPVAPSADREWFTLAVKVKPELTQTPESTRLSADRLSYVPGQSLTFYYTFIVFPAGEYTIGSPDDEPQRDIDEVRHRVRLSRPFAILNREVTFAELIAFNHARYEDYMGQLSQSLESTGAAVRWYDAVQFSRWLGTQYGLSETDQAYADPASPTSGERESDSGASWAPRNWPVDPSRRGFRLPSEAEWEIASRGGVRTLYGFGSDARLLEAYGWFRDNSGGRMHAPLERRPSHRGLFDMHGNAYEWVHDWTGEFGRLPATDPLGATGGTLRVVRGGGWVVEAALCRTALRDGYAPTLRWRDLGFRLALSFVEVPADSGQNKRE